MRIDRASWIIGVVAVGVFVTVLAGGVALASHRFDDVPDSHWAHDEIGWLVDNGIARGFPGNIFKPGDDINRQQAAFWFANYNNSLELVTSSDTDPVTTSITHGTSCPSGKRAIAGAGKTDVTNLHMTDSYPTAAGWAVRFEYLGTITPVTVTIEVWALCAPETIP